MDRDPRREHLGNARCIARSASRQTESLAHMLAAQAPIIGTMRENQQPVRCGSREPHSKTAIARAVAGAWREYLTATYLAAESTC